MNLSDFDYELPAGSIAQRPLAERDASRLLFVSRATGAWEDSQFRELPALLQGNELIVLNDARVLPARLFGHRAGLRAEPPGAKSPARDEFLTSPIEVLLIRQLTPDTWETLVRPGRKIPVGERIVFGEGELQARVEARAEYGLRVLRFESENGLHEALDRLGHIPLPPYIKRADEPLDRERYQTVYARQGNAVAAPTAGLHFTPTILESLEQRGIEIANLTLDVGLGTFEPIRTESLEEHKIHVESYDIPQATVDSIARAKREQRPVLAVGTTVVRALEDAAQKAVGSNTLLNAGQSEANIFLFPGKPFCVVDQLLTNFHLPRSSLLALVAAFTGLENTLAAYRHAVAAGYRFYSYGDCMLVR
ncbi:MAG TPA: tRNA preQ1(34) S-adenosylmethionine ribosyltransferase-isomerase QueA [Candidatus Acidoferrales bacterium]|nr:tRNA preQ1(34) S-adenosylmethionine ribosyltransferase-isomerase QueA [Candidatus Acidoferrales bacterium]